MALGRGHKTTWVTDTILLKHHLPPACLDSVTSEMSYNLMLILVIFHGRRQVNPRISDPGVLHMNADRNPVRLYRDHLQGSDTRYYATPDDSLLTHTTETR